MDNRQHGRKMAAPIIITVLMVLYFIFYFGAAVRLIPVPFLKVVFGVLPLLLGAGMIYVCIMRINEIQEGEEDDLGQY